MNGTYPEDPNHYNGSNMSIVLGIILLIVIAVAVSIYVHNENVRKLRVAKELELQERIEELEEELENSKGE